MNKDLIKQRFGRKLGLYNDNAGIQKQMAENLIQLLPDGEKTFLSVLEIGCGTGLLTELVYKNISFADYTAIDIVPGCKNFIEKIGSEIEFIPADIEEYIKTNTKNFDLVISNASFQWLENLQDFIQKIISRLNPGGMLLFSTFGTENYREVFYTIGKTLPYFSKKELEEQLKSYNPVINEEIRIMTFKSPKDVLKHIRNTGVNAMSAETWTKKNLIDFENRYNAFCANHPTLTYNPIYVKILK